MHHSAYLSTLYAASLIYVHKTRGLRTDAWADKFPAYLLSSYEIDYLDGLVRVLTTILDGKLIFSKDIKESIQKICTEIYNIIQQSSCDLLFEMRARSATIKDLVSDERLERARLLPGGGQWFMFAFKDQLLKFDEGRKRVEELMCDLEREFPCLLTLKKDIDVSWEPCGLDAAYADASFQ